MKAALFKGKGHVSIRDVDMPSIENPTDAIVKVIATSICGTDLHMYHGKTPFEKDHILGHEFVGIVEQVGEEVTSIKPGDRVVGTSSIACGVCFYCKMGYYSQCDNANPNAKTTAYFGSPAEGGGYNGAQAEYLRVPYANVGLYKLPDNITDEQALIMSDILPTGYFGAEMAEIKPGESVVIYGAGPVGQMAALSARLMGAERIFIVDKVTKRLEMAKEYCGAEMIDYTQADPVDEIMRLTDGNGVDKAIEAVGFEADTNTLEKIEEALHLEMSSGRSLRWAIESVRKCGVISVIGVFSGDVDNFPIGSVQMKNLTIHAGNCPHRRYLDILSKYISEGQIDPSYVITHRFNMDEIKDAYEVFDKYKEDCVKELITV